MIKIHNCYENNLKSVSLNIPHNKLIVVTGVSGSGKSTLVYDVIFKEARRRYIESFSANAGQFLNRLRRPDVENITGLLPGIALQQKSIVNSPRSTVGTLTEIYDLLRLLFSRKGKPAGKNIEISRSLFSYNSPKGQCPACKGLGVEDRIDPQLLIADANKTIRQGCFVMTTPSGYIVYSQVTLDVLNSVCNAEGFSIDIPWCKLTEYQKNIVLYGSDKIKVPFGKHTLESRMKWSGITAKPREEGYYKGIIPVMEEILNRDRNENVLRFARTHTCSVCNGSRLNEKALSVTYRGKNIAQTASFTINELELFFSNILNNKPDKIEQKIISEILKTARIIQKLGLGFLTLNRSSESLSGGETQRLRLAKTVTSQMRGILYVFDEPSIGLHPQEVNNLLDVIFNLKNNGNTVIIVEHNRQILENAEHIIDVGPGAGTHGGKIIFNGSANTFFNSNIHESKTKQYLQKQINFKTPGTSHKKFIEIHGASANNLKNIDVKFIINGLNVVTGLSGAGKSTLVNFTLSRYFLKKLNKAKENYGKFASISNDNLIEQIHIVDQAPIGKTPRSNPATYTGLSDELRNLFASLDDAKKKGFAKKHFSFNTKGGRCEKCEGAGYEQIGMQMLGTVEVVCSVCNGKQFKNEILQIKYKNKSIADIYAMTISEAAHFFDDQPKIKKYLQSLLNVGLGYLKLNQRSSTLSGGEARRVKLAKSLVKIPKKHTIYIIDEPSSGLHAYDIEVMLDNLNSLIKAGHTVVLVEQNEMFIKNADHLIELGPGSGNNGGEVIFQGAPEDVVKCKESKTAQALLNKYTVKNKKHLSNQAANLPVEMAGVSTHNLKNITVKIPVGKLTAITGVSGSGKSSLAFDTLFVEGRQRYAESFSAYMRNRLNINSQAKYEYIKGLMPTIAVNQKSVSQSDRSTVGTMTDIYDYMRLLFARVAKSPLHKEKPTASLFSFNNEQGACEHCGGLGFQTVCDAGKLITAPEKSIIGGAVDGSKPGKFYGDPYGQYVAILQAVAREYNIDYSKPWSKLSQNEKNIALYGTGSRQYNVVWKYKRKNRTGEHNFTSDWKGFLYYVNDEYLRKANDKRAEAILPVMSQIPCSQCNGARLNKTALSYTLAGKNIFELSLMEAGNLLLFLQNLLNNKSLISNNAAEQHAAEVIIEKIIEGLLILQNLGLGYLSLMRQAKTLSGGEGQRVRLASGIARNISGVCFVLDEPTAGLHPKDIKNLLRLTKQLITQGNTVVVCEHDIDFIKNCDYIFDLGPKAGKHGGNIVAEGTPQQIAENKNSVTGKYLVGNYTFFKNKKIGKSTEEIKISGASANNLKNIDIAFPENCLCVISGVSGSGKSSLLNNVIYKSFLAGKNINCRNISGLQKFTNVAYAEQRIPDRSSLSFIVSYLDIYKYIADVFAKQAALQNPEIKKTHFSLSGKQGKCNVCGGKGYLKTSLDFLSDSFEICPECNGNRYNNTVLQIKVNNCNIAQVLNMNFAELATFTDNKKIGEACKIIAQTGLEYIICGQPLNTLSGGEMQRLKLAKTLLESQRDSTLFLLDEPTSGLHMQDIELLINTFNLLLSENHSIIITEHHKTVIDSAGFVVELGPEGGEKGGKIINYC
jgi:excinuclease ABC subunit A